MTHRVPALPCIVCGKPLENVWADTANQPAHGIACISRGNYGSTAYDPCGTGEFIEFNVCDVCIEEAGNRGRVYTGQDRAPVYVEDFGDGMGDIIVGYVPADTKLVPWTRDYDDNLYQSFTVKSVERARQMNGIHMILDEKED